jgi:hypothetical protein
MSGNSSEKLNIATGLTPAALIAIIGIIVIIT